MYNSKFNGKFHCAEITPTSINRKCSRDALINRLRRQRNAQNVSFLEARGGADHFLVVPHNGYWFDLRPAFELHVGDPRLGRAVRFALEAGVKYEWPQKTTVSSPG